MKNLPRFLLLAATFYLIGDFFIINGRVSRWVESRLTTDTKTFAARVAGHPITRSQLERAINELLWLEGKSPAALTPAELQTSHDAALEVLIDDTLLDLQAKALTTQLVVSPEEIHERSSRLSGRFEDKAAFDAAMKSQGIASEQALRDRISARLLREKYVELRITPAIRVTDGEARNWFEENKASIALPERIEARHIFIPTLDHPPEEAKQKLDAALVELIEKKKEFSTLAKKLSEDPATKDNGGNLGWMTRDRLPADFSAPVFSLEIKKPTLVRTKLGWHLVEVTARKPAANRDFDQAKPEIVAALEAVKRQKATDDLRKSLRKMESAKIEIYRGPAAVSN